jgi:hypothetical protein
MSLLALLFWFHSMDSGLQLRAQQALAFFVGNTWTHNQAAGIVANLQAESMIDPHASQHGGGPGYGIAQWEHPRQRAFQDWSGHDIHGTDLAEQLAFVQFELLNTEADAGDALRKTQTAGDAGITVCRLYERPADTDGQAAYRCKLAEQIAKTYAQPSA